MTANRLLCKLLRLKSMRVSYFHLDEKAGRLDVRVKPKGNGRRCPLCGRVCRIVAEGRETRWWRDLVVMGVVVWLGYRPREVICREHGRIQEQVPWAARYSRATYRLEFALLKYNQIMTQKAAAELLRMPTSTLSEHIHRLVRRARDGHTIQGLTTIGVDEIAYHRGHKYATIVYDLDRSCVVWVGKGKRAATIAEFFEKHISEKQREGIKWACCDMAQVYIDAIKKYCENATLVLDRFHVAKALGKAVDDVRKEQWREASKKERKVLKGLRWILLSRASNRTPEQKATLRQLEKANHRIYRACRLKDEFDQFWDLTSTKEAEQHLSSWCKSALLSRLEPLRSFVGTLRAHFNDILAYVSVGGLTNAVAEGLNRIIKIVKNRASGFRTLEAFADMIFLNVGDVDIATHIPADFRIV